MPRAQIARVRYFEKENSEYQFFISARILSLASSTFMRERIKVMMASSTKGITRYMSFSKIGRAHV